MISVHAGMASWTPSNSFARRRLLVFGFLLAFVGCENDTNEPDSGSQIEPPPAGTSASTLLGDDGTASLPFGNSRIDFEITDTNGDPMAGAAVSFSVGADVLLVGVDDPSKRFPPALSVARIAGLNTANASVLAASSPLTVVNAGDESLSVAAAVEPGAIEFRESSISADLLDSITADEGLEDSCGLERDLDSSSEGGSSSGSGIISFVELGQEVAFTADAPPDSAVAGLGFEYDLLGTDILQGCELLIGSSNERLVAFAVRAARFPGIYAVSDGLSDLYIVQVEPDGRDIFVETIMTGREGVALSGITDNPDPNRYSLLGLGGQGSRLVKISRRTGEAVVVGDWHFVGFNGLATAGRGRLVATGRDGLSEIDSRTGELTAKGEYGPNLRSVGAIAFAEGGTLFGILYNKLGRGSDVHYLARIDTATSVATIVGELRKRASGYAILEMYGMSFLAGELYGLTTESRTGAGGILVRIDTLTALVDEIRRLTFDADGAASNRPGK